MRLTIRERSVVVLSRRGFAASARVRLVVAERHVARFGREVRDSFNLRQPRQDRTRPGRRLHSRNGVDCHPEGRAQAGGGGARTI